MMKRQSCRGRPQAVAHIRGSADYPNLCGTVQFFQTPGGVLVRTELQGLPHTAGRCTGRVFGFHIHEGGSCAADMTDPFAGAMAHYNPDGCEHPQHAGDLPPLFESCGRAFSVVLTDRFRVHEVIGKTVIVHAGPDDFTTQPSGNSGEKIACGVICGCT